jgi:hypothetical protein
MNHGLSKHGSCRCHALFSLIAEQTVKKIRGAVALRPRGIVNGFRSSVLLRLAG